MNIKAEKINVVLDKFNILKEINMEVDNKEFVGIIGPNGSGKSTFLKCLYRVLKPSKGIIKLDGIDMRSISVKESSKMVGVLSQHNNYNFDFTVKDIVLMGRSPHKKFMERDNKEDYDIVNNALENVDMLDLKDRTFQSLSGGEQQRVILARALAQNPKCLILDEPTNHLDIKYQLQLMKIVRNLNIEVIAAIHDLNIAAMYCDKIFVLKDGEIIKYGKPKDVLTKELIKDVYEVDSKIIVDKERVHISYLL
ncbi:ABC transporter ATP-binding protein [Clostridium nigeriense]|uniref:ABC transporter ATP-binding protein n=1 Tax=Clostridium nigeriense TaxID=1805470 RepID=UPI003D34BA60